MRVGDTAVAIGNPFGLDRTATAGIVSGLGRHIQAPNGFEIDKVIQTDAPINPGNSGGPLLDARGRVIGVNSQIETGGSGSGNVGIGFAVPSNTVREVVPQPRAGQDDRARLPRRLDAAAERRAARRARRCEIADVTAAARPTAPACSAATSSPRRRHGASRPAGRLRGRSTGSKPGDQIRVEVVRGGGTRARRT